MSKYVFMRALDVHSAHNYIEQQGKSAKFKFCYIKLCMGIECTEYQVINMKHSEK